MDMMMEEFGGEIAPADAETPYCCRECKRYLTADEENAGDADFFICHEAGLDCDIRYSSAHLTEVKNIKDAVWYHATDNPEWMETLLTIRQEQAIPMVHIGTKETAYEVLHQKYRRLVSHWGDAAVLYSLRLKDGVAVSPVIHEDMNDWIDIVGENNGGADAYPYVNLYEFPGSISLLVDPRHLIVEEVKFFSEKEEMEQAIEEVLPAGRLATLRDTPDFTGMYLL